MTQLQRREALLTAAAIGSLPLLKLWPEAQAAEPGWLSVPPSRSASSC